jgi:outer membrane receptor protein involved in Fe transport
VLANHASGINVYKQTINMKAVYPNTSLFVQDEWKATDRFSLSAGLRWELNPAPHDANGNTPYTVDQITDLSTVTLAPKGTALWKTTYNNFAPRSFIARLKRVPCCAPALASSMTLERHSPPMATTAWAPRVSSRSMARRFP